MNRPLPVVGPRMFDMAQVPRLAPQILTAIALVNSLAEIIYRAKIHVIECRQARRAERKLMRRNRGA